MPLTGYEELNVSDWDGYGADPVKPETLAFAQKIAAMLDRGPDDAPGGDGSICWEWRNGDDILCLDVQAEGDFRIYGTIDGTFYRLTSAGQGGLKP